jgi:hypothetical protein
LGKEHIFLPDTCVENLGFVDWESQSALCPHSFSQLHCYFLCKWSLAQKVTGRRASAGKQVSCTHMTQLSLVEENPALLYSHILHSIHFNITSTLSKNICPLPVVPATREAELQGSLESRSLTSLGNTVRAHLKKRKGKEGREGGRGKEGREGRREEGKKEGRKESKKEGGREARKQGKLSILTFMKRSCFLPSVIFTLKFASVALPFEIFLVTLKLLKGRIQNPLLPL